MIQLTYRGNHRSNATLSNLNPIYTNGIAINNKVYLPVIKSRNEGEGVKVQQRSGLSVDPGELAKDVQLRETALDKLEQHNQPRDNRQFRSIEQKSTTIPKDQSQKCLIETGKIVGNLAKRRGSKQELKHRNVDVGMLDKPRQNKHQPQVVYPRNVSLPRATNPKASKETSTITKPKIADSYDFRLVSATNTALFRSRRETSTL